MSISWQSMISFEGVQDILLEKYHTVLQLDIKEEVIILWEIWNEVIYSELSLPNWGVYS